MKFKNIATSVMMLSVITACAPSQKTTHGMAPTDTYSLVGKITTSDGNRDEFISLLTEALASTNCISFSILPDKSDTNVVWVAETWPSEAAHDEALLAPEIQEKIKKGRPMIVSMERKANTEN